jgi:hypothetical protein
LEGRERSKDGTTDPDRVFTLWGSNNLDLHGAGSQSGNLLLHTVGNTGVHGSTTRHDDVGVQVLTDIDITFHDRVIGSLMDTSGFQSDKRGLEESFRSTEAAMEQRVLSTDKNKSTKWVYNTFSISISDTYRSFPTVMT